MFRIRFSACIYNVNVYSVLFTLTTNTISLRAVVPRTHTQPTLRFYAVSVDCASSRHALRSTDGMSERIFHLVTNQTSTSKHQR